MSVNKSTILQSWVNKVVSVCLTKNNGSIYQVILKDIDELGVWLTCNTQNEYVESIIGNSLIDSSYYFYKDIEIITLFYDEDGKVLEDTYFKYDSDDESDGDLYEIGLELKKSFILDKSFINNSKPIKEEKDIYLIQNAMRLGSDIYNSVHRHDFISLEYNGYNYTIDGGLDYTRGNYPIDSIELDTENLVLCPSDPFETVKSKLLWGHRGITGQDPLKYKKLIDCDTNHLENILKNIPNISEIHRLVIDSILLDRNEI